MRPAQSEKASTNPKRRPSGSAVDSMPISHAAAMAQAVRTSRLRAKPCERSQPPARLPGMLASTMRAVAAAAVAVDAPCSERKVGSHTITVVHCAT